jgi:hypothetical protein
MWLCHVRVWFIQIQNAGQVADRLGYRSSQLVTVQISANPLSPIGIGVSVALYHCVQRCGFRFVESPYRWASWGKLPIDSGIDPVSWLSCRYLPIHYRQLVLVSVLHCTTVYYVVVSGLSRIHTGDRVEASCRSTRVSIRSVDYRSDICQSIIVNWYWCECCIVPLCTTLWFQVCRESIQVSELRQVADRLGYRSVQLIVVQISGHATDS